MILELLLKLVDRLIDLSKRHEEVNRALFVDFVQPIFQTFETVHADYIDSLTRADTTLRMDLSHPVFGDIELDSLKSKHLRTKLKDFKPANSTPRLREFLSAIDFYLRGVSASGLHAKLFDKLAGGQRGGLSIDDLKGLAVERNLDDYKVFAGGSGRSDVIFSDPMRQVLRELLMGFDAPKDLNDEQEHDMLREGALSISFDDDRRRRELCSMAVKRTMLHFQTCYNFASSAYSILRSELLSQS